MYFDSYLYTSPDKHDTYMYILAYYIIVHFVAHYPRNDTIFYLYSSTTDM